MITTTYHAPLGDIELVADERGLTGLWFAGKRPAALPASFAQAKEVVPFAEAASQAPVEEIDASDAESGTAGVACEDQRNAAALGVIERTWGWLNSYFAGQTPLWLPPLHVEGDELAHEVWAALLAVPYGGATTCKELAAGVSSRGMVRAQAADVAEVLSNAPIALIMPLHRVSDAPGSANQRALAAWERK